MFYFAFPFAMQIGLRKGLASFKGSEKLVFALLSLFGLTYMRIIYGPSMQLPPLVKKFLNKETAAHIRLSKFLVFGLLVLTIVNNNSIEPEN